MTQCYWRNKSEIQKITLDGVQTKWKQFLYLSRLIDMPWTETIRYFEAFIGFIHSPQIKCEATTKIIPFSVEVKKPYSIIVVKI